MVQTMQTQEVENRKMWERRKPGKVSQSTEGVVSEEKRGDAQGNSGKRREQYVK